MMIVCQCNTKRATEINICKPFLFAKFKASIKQEQFNLRWNLSPFKLLVYHYCPIHYCPIHRGNIVYSCAQSRALKLACNWIRQAVQFIKNIFSYIFQLSRLTDVSQNKASELRHCILFNNRSRIRLINIFSKEEVLSIYFDCCVRLHTIIMKVRLNSITVNKLQNFLYTARLSASMCSG